MKSSNISVPSVELDARVAQFGLRVAASLTERSATLPHDVTERLRFAREQALVRAAQARAASTAQVASPAISANLVQQGSTLALGGGPRGGTDGGLWAKLVSALPLLALVVGLVLMQHSRYNQQIAAAAEVDTALLSDSLPPSAFRDPGFAEFLRDGDE
jgi:hypothetical protein